MTKIHPDIAAALDATGLPYEVEKGGRHYKLKLSGRLAGILPRTPNESQSRAIRNTISQIRRLAAQLNQKD